MANLLRLLPNAEQDRSELQACALTFRCGEAFGLGIELGAIRVNTNQGEDRKVDRAKVKRLASHPTSVANEAWRQMLKDLSYAAETLGTRRLQRSHKLTAQQP